MGRIVSLFSVCARSGRSYCKKMRKLPIVKNAILLIIMVWLSLKVWTTVSEIANSPKNNNDGTSNNSLKYKNLAKDSPLRYNNNSSNAKKTDPIDKYTSDREVIQDVTIKSLIETTKSSQESDGKLERMKSINSTSVKASGEKSLRFTSRGSSSKTTISKSDSQDTTTKQSKNGDKHHNIQPYTIKVQSSKEGSSIKTTTGESSSQNATTIQSKPGDKHHNIQPYIIQVQSSSEGSYTQTTISKGSLQNTTTKQSKTGDKQQSDQPQTIKVPLNTDDELKNRRITPAKTKEKRHVMLLKVHKCGSSSVQNIFLRFGYQRNLTFILGHDDKNKSESGFTNVISYKHTLSDELIVPPPPGRHFDILCCHVIYNEDRFHKYLPEDTVYIGIAREPVKRLESSFHYFNMFKNVEMSEFARDPLKYDKRFPSMANNRMAFEYGFPKECFPPLNSSLESTKNLISSYLNSIDKRFDFIIINERMDESLVYMKRLLGWQLKDILFVRLLTSKGSSRKFEEQDALKLRDFLYLDYALYEFAVRRFIKAIANVSDDFQGEVKHFQDLNIKVGEFCKSKSNQTFTIVPSRWNAEFTITIEDCQYFSKHEMKFIQEIRQKQYGTINN